MNKFLDALRLKSLRRYYLVSISALLIDLSLTFAFRSVGLYPWATYLVTGILVTMYLFALSSLYVFSSDFALWRREMPRFLVVAVFNIAAAQVLLSASSLFVLSPDAGGDVLVRLTILGALATIKFFILEKYVFRKRIPSVS